MTDRTRKGHTMKRIAITLGVAAVLGVAPASALAGNVRSQVVESQVVQSQVRSQVIRPGLVESALVKPALVKSALVRSHKASAARIAQFRALPR